MSRIKRILVPTDFGVTSDLAVNYAIDMAYRFGAAVHLLHVIEDGPFTATYPDGFFAGPVSLREQMQNDAQTRLVEAAARCLDRGIQTTTALVFGRPAATIGEWAMKLGADLIVMGTHGRRGVAHLVLGSVAERVVRTAPCAVLTVRDTAHVVETLAAADALAQPEPTNA